MRVPVKAIGFILGERASESMGMRSGGSPPFLGLLGLGPLSVGAGLVLLSLTSVRPSVRVCVCVARRRWSGHGGQNIKQLREQSGARIQVANLTEVEAGSATVRVDLEGSPAMVRAYPRHVYTQPATPKGLACLNQSLADKQCVCRALAWAPSFRWRPLAPCCATA